MTYTDFLIASTLDDPSVFAFLLLIGALFTLTFYRLSRLDAEVDWRIRAAYYVLGVTAAFGGFNVIAWGHDPSWTECAMVAGFVLVQAATMRAWREDRYPKGYKSDHGEFDDGLHHHHNHA